jgi:rRNA maturation protein Nop10
MFKKLVYCYHCGTAHVREMCPRCGSIISSDVPTIPTGIE